MGDYLEEVLALAKLGGFTVLGHLTLPLRYFNEMRGLHTSFDPYEAEIREILKTLIENGRGIELNVNRGNTPLPDAKWLRIYGRTALFGETLEIIDYSPEIDTELRIICFPTFKGHCGCILFDQAKIQTVSECAEP